MQRPHAVLGAASLQGTQRKGMANPDEFGFVWLLIIALVLIVIFSVVSIPGGGPTQNVTVAEFTLGSVGTQAEASKAYSLGTVVVGEPQKEVLKTIPQVSLGANLFSADTLETTVTVPDYLFDTLRDGAITFGVLETNNYGDLVVQWNGKELYRGKASLGPQTLALSRDLIKPQNTLRLTATGPGWRFWAGTVYILGNVQVSVRTGPAKLAGFDLSNSDLQGFDRGELTFTASGAQDKLLVAVNNRVISSRTPAGPTTVPFTISDAPLRAGTNVLALSSNSTMTLIDANLRVYTLGPGTVRERTFNLTQSHLDQLKASGARGAVRYEVAAVDRAGTLTFTLNGNPLPASRPELGSNAASFSAAEARAGENTLQASGTGAFQVGRVTVTIEK